MNELMPCPFCDHSSPKKWMDDIGWGQFQTRLECWWIQCQGAHCYATQQGSTEEKVINRWNRRHEKVSSS